MFFYWIKCNLADMGWFFNLKLSEPTLIIYTTLLENKMKKRLTGMSYPSQYK